VKTLAVYRSAYAINLRLQSSWNRYPHRHSWKIIGLCFHKIACNLIKVEVLVLDEMGQSPQHGFSRGDRSDFSRATFETPPNLSLLATMDETLEEIISALLERSRKNRKFEAETVAQT